MRDSLRHRGPDGDGLRVDGRCGLVHTRLAVLDLSSRARQPMASPSGRYAITYNGEVYNFAELRAALEAKGRGFRTSSDTEVIVQLMEEGGAEALDSLRGMFALAIFDRERGELLLMRDRLGIKPLFWAQGEWGVAFASEPKALRGLVPAASPPPEWVAEFLAFRHVAGQECLVPGIRTLEPGHRLRTNGRELRVERWWSPGFDRDAQPDAIDAILADAVRRQLVSDVPVGTFLSGGVDSALVTAAAASALPQIDSFTVGFDEPGWDESDRARLVAEQVGARMHRFALAPDAYVRGLAEATWFLDSPLNHAHSVHLLALSRFARGHVTVALTGEGADELLGGYPRYRMFRLGRAASWLPERLSLPLATALRPHHARAARLLDATGPDAQRAAALNAAFVPVGEAARLAGLERPELALETRRRILAEARSAGCDDLQALLELDRRTYIVSLLQRMDRMSMAAGLETRVPLLDESMLEFALRLDATEKVGLRETKKPLRRAAERRFGREYARAPKSGFGVPVGLWMRSGGPLDALASRLLTERRTLERGWVDAGRVRRLLDDHRASRRDEAETLWGLLCLELWARVCVDGDGPQATCAG